MSLVPKVRLYIQVQPTLKIIAAITIGAFFSSRWQSTLEENINIYIQM